jgi:hypothetical protein
MAPPIQHPMNKAMTVTDMVTPKPGSKNCIMSKKDAMASYYERCSLLAKRETLYKERKLPMGASFLQVNNAILLIDYIS